jgi:hypothetical protein
MSGWCSLMACSSSRAYRSIWSCVILLPPEQSLPPRPLSEVLPSPAADHYEPRPDLPGEVQYLIRSPSHGHDATDERSHTVRTAQVPRKTPPRSCVNKGGFSSVWLKRAVVRMGRCVGVRSGVRATAVEPPAELLVECLPAALRLACRARPPLRRLHSAGHQEGPLSGCSWAP